MRILITAGPTREPIDPVRYIGNRSSGRMGSALAAAATAGGHTVTLIAGPVSVPLPDVNRRIDIETTAQLHAAVLDEFSAHDLLIMAAAVADYRPVHVAAEKLGRKGKLTLELESTPDIVGDVAGRRRRDQRIVGFSLESGGNIARAREKLLRKRIDMIVFNPIETMDSPDISAVLLYPDGRTDQLPPQSKESFSAALLARSLALFG